MFILTWNKMPHIYIYMYIIFINPSLIKIYLNDQASILIF